MTREGVPLTRAGQLPALLLFVAALPATTWAEPDQSPGAPLPLPEHADQGALAVLRVGWPDIVELVERDPRVAAGRHEVRAAQAAVDAAGAVPNPHIEATTAYGQAIDSSASRVEWGLGLSLPLGWIAQRGAKMDVAGAEARVREASARALRRDVLLQLGDLYWNLVYEQERSASLAELSSHTEALATTVQRRVEQGEIRPVEATRVEVEAEKVAGELEVARASLRVGRAQLATWLGVRSGQQLVAVADLTSLPPPPAADRVGEKVRNEHPSIAAASLRVQALAAGVKVERRARVPSFSLTAFAEHELDRRAYGLGLVVDLPVWNWNTGNIQRSESMLAAGQSRLEAQRLALEAVALEAQGRCQAGVILARRYQDRILPRAAAAAQTIERTYQLGEATLLEVIDASRTLLETRMQLLTILARAQANCARLRLLLGEESR